jgi:hypothetical protein
MLVIFAESRGRSFLWWCFLLWDKTRRVPPPHFEPPRPRTLLHTTSISARFKCVAFHQNSPTSYRTQLTARTVFKRNTRRVERSCRVIRMSPALHSTPRRLRSLEVERRAHIISRVSSHLALSAVFLRAAHAFGRHHAQRREASRSHLPVT